jgi:putative ABC transport system permease protein
MLAKELVLLVLIAAVVATPLAWLAASKWLQNFEYRVNIQWWVFAAAGLVAMLLAFITISVRSVKAALANPVKSLRFE